MELDELTPVGSIAASYLGEIERLIERYSDWWYTVENAMDERFGNVVRRSQEAAERLSGAPDTKPDILGERMDSFARKLEEVIVESKKLYAYYDKSGKGDQAKIVVLFGNAAAKYLGLFSKPVNTKKAALPKSVRVNKSPIPKKSARPKTKGTDQTPKKKSQEVKNFWLLRLNGNNWDLNELLSSQVLYFHSHRPQLGRAKDYALFEDVVEGDEGFAYAYGRPKAIVFQFRVVASLHDDPLHGEIISFQIVKLFDPPIRYESIIHALPNAKALEENSPLKLFTLTEDQFNRILSLAPDAPPPIVQNELKAATLDNDGAFASDDLLDFTKDIRALATIMAMKDVKPPLAIALFGQWGTGKSFFMNQLRITINTLAQHQGFPKDPKQPVDQSQIKEKIFCEGVVQIEFNAWSYLDANLWAGLVSTIFERLDEYINDNVPGDDEREGVQKKLSEKLMIVSEQKRQVLNEKSNLTTKRDQLKVDIENAENDKTRLLEEIRKKSLDEIREKALQQLQPLTEQIKNKLIESGITEERLKELSPNALFDEVKSWVTFGRNLIKFNNREIFVFLLALTALLVLIIDPTGFFQEQMKAVGRGAMIILSFAGPLFVKTYNEFKKYKDLFSPILAFKNNFNERVQASEYDHQKKLHLLEAELSQNDSKLTELTDVLIGIDQEIAEVEHALKYSITKQAFFNFINKKNEDDAYAKHLGIISTVRRDFETLSNLFKGANESTGDEEKKNEEFRGYFKKPLDRIVLYVDDLDRCPDDKVMEVLQAVHLLMAFPLFIVVVGVDKRCVHNALAHRNLLQYSQYLKNGAFEQLEQLGINVIKPAEYLEKIFQIPFHLEEASDDNIKTMVDSLLKDQVLPDEQPETKTEKQPENEFKEGLNQLNKMTNNMLDAMTGVDDGGQPYSAEQKRDTVREQKPAKQVYVAPEDLKLTAIELEYLREISALVGNTPRTIKRYINMYRIIRAHELLSYHEESKHQTFLSIMLILALNIGPHRDYAPFFFNNCQTLSDRPLKYILDQATDTDNIVAVLSESSSLKTLLDVKGEVFLNHIPFVKRFSFNTYEAETIQVKIFQDVTQKLSK